jgi:hypothetical protein
MYDLVCVVVVDGEAWARRHSGVKSCSSDLGGSIRNAMRQQPNYKYKL